MKIKNTIYLFVLLAGAYSCREDSIKGDASGSFEAVETIIGSEANGKILRFIVEEGQSLDSGQVVGYIDSTQVHLSKLRLVQQKKAVLSGRVQNNVQTEAFKAELKNAVLDRDRTENLVKGGVASQKQLDDANARVSTLKARINAQENSLQTTTSSINEQGSTIDAQLLELNDQLRKCVITNSVKGTVLTKYAEPYEIATIGKPLYRIADLSTIILRAYITGDQLQQVKIGQTVQVFTDDGKGSYRETPGVITWINDKAEFTPKTIQTKNERANLVYAIKVSVKNDGSLKIGMYGEVGWSL